ncbi:hypothetical protein KUCAC02_031012 [Chaenocephalus aceratus]|uniref:Uncharacterized protein n=1 Tax=Chaenocephalus aceratus TaxID=36190 RepID=A0ACB9XLJ0_CHAAC|nr:hypothetical protein KUCAC02_031012 [Chaenocephalus aceratus]
MALIMAFCTLIVNVLCLPLHLIKALGIFVVASGEDMGAIESESVDVVVCTLVLCSVNNIPKTLQETRRMLRPHVLQPPWYYFGDGCEIVRDTWKPLEATGFSDLKLKHVEAPLMFLIKPHIIGYAVK